MYNHVIGFSDLVDLWVIKIRKPMILCARRMSRSREQSKKRRSRSENMRKVCLFYSHNNKIVWLSNMTDAFFLEKFTRCAKVCGLFLSFFLSSFLSFFLSFLLSFFLLSFFLPFFLSFFLPFFLSRCLAGQANSDYMVLKTYTKLIYLSCLFVCLLACFLTVLLSRCCLMLDIMTRMSLSIEGRGKWQISFVQWLACMQAFQQRDGLLRFTARFVSPKRQHAGYSMTFAQTSDLQRTKMNTVL